MLRVSPILQDKNGTPSPERREAAERRERDFTAALDRLGRSANTSIFAIALTVAASPYLGGSKRYAAQCTAGAGVAILTHAVLQVLVCTWVEQAPPQQLAAVLLVLALYVALLAGEIMVLSNTW